MRPNQIILAVGAFALATLAASAQPAQEGTKEPSKILIATLVEGEGLDKLVPKGNFLTKQADFDALWKAWLLKDPAPTVDFKTSLVVVAVIRFGPIKNVVLLDRSSKGDMTIQMALEGKAETKSFYTMLADFPRAGIKSIKGTPIDPK